MIAVFCIEFFNENYLNFHNLVIILWNIHFSNKNLYFQIWKKKIIIKNFCKIHNLLHITIQQIALIVFYIILQSIRYFSTRNAICLIAAICWHFENFVFTIIKQKSSRKQKSLDREYPKTIN